MKYLNGTAYIAALIVLIMGGCESNIAGNRSVEHNKPHNTNEQRFQHNKPDRISLINTNKSISGTDLNRNGIRDDVEAYISAMPDTELQKDRLAKFHKAIMAAMLADTENEAELRNTGNELSKSSHCLSYAYGAEVAFEKGREIQKLTVDTKPRYLAYTKYNHAIDGSVFFMPPKACDSPHL